MMSIPIWQTKASGLTNKRLGNVQAELKSRIDGVRVELMGRLDETNKRLDPGLAALDQRLAAVHHDVILRIDKTNDWLNQLYAVILRRDNHEDLKTRIDRLEHNVAVLKQRFAA